MSATTQQPGLESLEIVTLVVDDVDESLAFFTETLGFEVRMDDAFEMGDEDGRWVTVGLPGQDLQISLVTAEEPYYDRRTRRLLRRKRGEETWWTFRVADCEAAVAALREADVDVTQEPTDYPWGTEAMFADPSGNEFSLFEYGDM